MYRAYMHEESNLHFWIIWTCVQKMLEGNKAIDTNHLSSSVRKCKCKAIVDSQRQTKVNFTVNQFGKPGSNW